MVVIRHILTASPASCISVPERNPKQVIGSLVIDTNYSCLARRDGRKACVFKGIRDHRAFIFPLVLVLSILDFADGAPVTVGRTLGFLIEDAESVVVSIWTCNHERGATCNIGVSVEFKRDSGLPHGITAGGVVHSFALDKGVVSRGSLGGRGKGELPVQIAEPHQLISIPRRSCARRSGSKHESK
jgi:hypothetical protein